MKVASGFKTRASTYTIGLAPTSRAKCRVCKQGVEKGEVRVVTHAFVRPGRSHDFVCHLRCATTALVRAMLRMYGSMERVPMTTDMDIERRDEVCVLLSAKM